MNAGKVVAFTIKRRVITPKQRALDFVAPLTFTYFSLFISNPDHRNLNMLPSVVINDVNNINSETSIFSILILSYRHTYN